jgi:hypothetical protein
MKEKRDNNGSGTWNVLRNYSFSQMLLEDLIKTLLSYYACFVREID